MESGGFEESIDCRTHGLTVELRWKGLIHVDMQGHSSSENDSKYSVHLKYDSISANKSL